MTMQTYWDLSEKDRAALSREDVEKFGDAELMLKGVLKVQPLTLEPLPPVAAPAKQIFRVRVGSKYQQSTLDVGFATAEEAQAFLALGPLHVTAKWLKGKNVEACGPIDEHELVAETMYTAAEVTASTATLERRAAVEAENEKRQREYDDAMKKQADALSGMWEDWYACQEKAMRMQRVVDTFNDYVRITGGQRDVAGTFLLKVFDRDVIREATAWTGIEIPTEIAAEAAPTRKAEPSDDIGPQL